MDKEEKKRGGKKRGRRKKAMGGDNRLKSRQRKIWKGKGRRKEKVTRKGGHNVS